MARRHRKNSGCIGLLVLMIAGCAFGAIGFFLMLKPEWEARYTFVETTSTVISAKLVDSRSKEGNRLYRPEFRIRYTVDGKAYEEDAYRIVQGSSSSKGRNQKVVNSFKVGESYPCWYDPEDPKRVVLDRSFSLFSLLFTGVGVLLAGIGALFLFIKALKAGLAIGFLATRK